jgi:ATP-dependent Clp protease ATP-binding subunit ClpA
MSPYSSSKCNICTLQARKQAEEAALRVVHQHFRPEFLNRIDETVVFEALSPAQLREIARLQVLFPVSTTAFTASKVRALVPDVYVSLACMVSD